MEVDEAHAGSRRLRLLLAPDADAPATARRALRELPLGAREEEVLLATSELVTNAVMHAGHEPGEPIELVAACDDGGTRVEVRDRGPGFGGDAPDGGLGLQMVASAADRWGIEQDGATCVWFEVD